MEILDVEVEKLVHLTMAKNTWKTYKTALESLAKFSKEYDLNLSWPIQIDVLTRFIAYLSYSGLTSSTINTYLSGISHKHKLLGVTDTTCTLIVSKMLEGVRRKSPKLSDIRAPVTLEILHKIIRSLPFVCSSHYESCLFASAFSLAFFTLLRIGELTADRSTDIGAHTIFINDLSLKFSNCKYELHLKICSSKADQRGISTTLVIPQREADLCPVSMLRAFLGIRYPVTDKPLYLHFNGSPLTRFQFISILKKTLYFCGVKDHIRSHSFRIGGASHYSRMGASDSEIKKWGRWVSDAYTSYIRIW
ncbi:unnamed protein product [Mytilus coruscus]|uniref:Tyr recombinase domain-containing protein n=1 Tax=Mytilus coruscus TaxID=42192 RepID=A0A6J8CYM8_MYTCO|nr:unnamed protein product [Mytilus coruscus]